MNYVLVAIGVMIVGLVVYSIGTNREDLTVSGLICLAAWSLVSIYYSFACGG